MEADSERVPGWLVHGYDGLAIEIAVEPRAGPLCSGATHGASARFDHLAAGTTDAVADEDPPPPHPNVRGNAARCSCKVARYGPPPTLFGPQDRPATAAAVTAAAAATASGVSNQDQDRPPKRRRKKKGKGGAGRNRGEVELAERHARVRAQLQRTTEGVVAAHRVDVATLPESTRPSKLDTADGRKPDFATECHNAALQQAGPSLSLPPVVAAATVAHTAACVQTGLQDTAVVNRLVSNDGEGGTVVIVGGVPHAVPPRCRFLCADMRVARTVLPQQAGRFDLVVLDPPWANKSVQRGSQYGSLGVDSLLGLPVARLCAPGALVACWITNNPTLIRALQDELFPAWGLRPVAEWHWVKVTRAGEMVGDLDSVHKKPYEPIFIGRYGAAPLGVPDPPSRAVVVSVPCLQHSRKPALTALLDPFCGTGGPPGSTSTSTSTSSATLVATAAASPPRAGPPRRLELFARNLLPGWTSWGNEVLKFQQIGPAGLQRTDRGCQGCSVAAPDHDPD